MQLLLLVIAALLAVGVDLLSWRRGLTPPAHRLLPEWPLSSRIGPMVLRAFGWGAVAVVLWIAVLSPIASFGQPPPESFEGVSPAGLFVLHAGFFVALVLWFGSGFLPRLPVSPRIWWRVWSAQLGWRASKISRELALGLAAGVAGWTAVLAIVYGVAAVAWAVGAEELVPQEPPAVMEYLIGLPVAVRLALAASAGLAEETFFRGFLQPRAGIALSSTLFVLAHLSYGQPFMLLGVALLSILFAWLVRWRQSIWAAVVAHATFDAIQLLVVLPVLHRYGL
ncbi:MAG: lysostaphin resistance A-like protein [Thermoanaerobaculia bacterium]